MRRLTNPMYRTFSEIETIRSCVKHHEFPCFDKWYIDGYSKCLNNHIEYSTARLMSSLYLHQEEIVIV